MESQYELDKQIGYLLRLASQRHSVIFQNNTIDNITPTHWYVFVMLENVHRTI